MTFDPYNQKVARKSVGVVLAGGKGTRMSPLTQTTPKPMLEVGNMPILARHLQKFAPMVDEIVIVVSWLADQIENYFGNSFDGKKISYAYQQNPSGGTLDAFRTAIYAKPEFLEANYFVSNSDDLIDQVFFNSLLKASLESPEFAHLCARKITDRELLKRYGVFEIEEGNQNEGEQSFRLKMLYEKPTEFISEMVNIGLYYLPHTISNLVSITPNLAVDGKEEYITDLFNQFNKLSQVYIVPVDGNYFSLTSPQDIIEANQKFSLDRLWI
jgi:bifunctional UDP-N-acetylglucosamine pyrophosphorylase/glucosamine-1-phosphate N-acetyltransferase